LGTPELSRLEVVMIVSFFIETILSEFLQHDCWGKQNFAVGFDKN
jgi:hypothetical protein